MIPQVVFDVLELSQARRVEVGKGEVIVDGRIVPSLGILAGVVHKPVSPDMTRACVELVDNHAIVTQL